MSGLCSCIEVVCTVILMVVERFSDLILTCKGESLGPTQPLLAWPAHAPTLQPMYSSYPLLYDQNTLDNETEI